MAWNEYFDVDGLEFFLTTLEGPPSLCFSVELIQRMNCQQFKKIKKWASECAGERYVIGLAHECEWSSQFIGATELKLIINSKTATDEERGKAREALQFIKRGLSYPPPQKEEPRPPKKVAGHVYLLVSENGLYKIGKAKRLDERVTNLGIKLPIKIELIHSIVASDYTWAEQYLHSIFAHKRVHGEWFNLDSEDIEYICSISQLEKSKDAI